MKFITKQENNYGNYEDSGVSGVATSADVHSIEYDELAVAANEAPMHSPPATAICHHTATCRKGPVSRISSVSTTTQSTIKQHYYPEGGWGWIIVVVGTLVAILNHGLFMSSGIILIAITNRFNEVHLTDAGIFCFLTSIFINLLEVLELIIYILIDFCHF